MFPRTTSRTARRFTLLLLSGLIVLAASSASAQIDPDDPLLLGVYVSKDGLLGVERSQDDSRQLTARRAALVRAGREARAAGKKEQLGYISLPRLFAQAKKAVDAGQPIPDDVRFMGGMTKVKYIFVFPDKKDLVLAGDVEPYDKKNPARPIGLFSGRPVLQLEDLVVTLRHMGPGHVPGQIGCSIDPPRNAMQIVSDIIKDPTNRRVSKAEKSQMMVQNVGPQTVRYINIAADTRVAYVIVEADYLLKRMAMGVDPSPVAAVRHQKQNDRLQFNRLWLVPHYEPLLVSDDGLSYEIRGQGIKLNASSDQFADKEASLAAEGYAKNFTKYFPQLAAAVPSYADLWNITDLAYVSALIAQDRLDRKAGWDLSWVMSEKGCPLTEVTPVQTAETMAYYRTGAYVVGGVDLRFVDDASPKERQKDEEGKLKELPALPADEDWALFK